MHLDINYIGNLMDSNILYRYRWVNMHWHQFAFDICNVYSYFPLLSVFFVMWANYSPGSRWRVTRRCGSGWGSGCPSGCVARRGSGRYPGTRRGTSSWSWPSPSPRTPPATSTSKKVIRVWWVMMSESDDEWWVMSNECSECDEKWWVTLSDFWMCFPGPESNT